jgi:predicted PurR-regulated permease PerM
MIKLLLPLVIFLFCMVMVYLIWKIILEIGGFIKKKSNEEKELDNKITKLSEDEIKVRKKKSIASKIANIHEQIDDIDQKTIEKYFRSTRKK